MIRSQTHYAHSGDASIAYQVGGDGPVDLVDAELRARLLDAIDRHWGDGSLLEVYAPSQLGNRSFEQFWGGAFSAPPQAPAWLGR